MPTSVVNIRTHSCDFYIGRPPSTYKPAHEHFGNPFSHLDTPQAIKVTNRDEAIAYFDAWIREEAFEDVKPEQRAYMLANLEMLAGKRLGCFCAPKPCHGDKLIELLQEKGLL